MISSPAPWWFIGPRQAVSSPNPRLQRTPPAPLSRKPFGGLKGLSRLLAILGSLGSLTCKSDWANPVTTEGLHTLAPSSIQSVTISRDPCEADARAVDSSQWPEFLGRLRKLQPAMSIGERGPWDTVCLFRIRLPAGSVKIDLSTRKSLPGKVIAIVDGGPIGPGLSFYEATAFASWVSGAFGPNTASSSTDPRPCK